jgi:tetratricopeptide (TPR) repeat protein
LDLPDCYRFYEWLRGERERIRTLRLGVLDALVERLGSSPEDALAYARQRIAIDPLEDTAHATVVRLLARLGRNAEALAQVESCRRILERELGGRRSHALEVARAEIGQTRAAAARQAPPVETRPARPEAPSSVVARTKEREALARLVADGATGNVNVLVLSGEPGIGKSTLLRELGRLVSARGGALLTGRAFEGESVRPFGVWIDMLRSERLERLDRDLRRDLAPLFPELGVVASDAESRARLFDGVLRMLRTLPPPVVIAIDDLHWLDDASSGLLHYVARASAGSPIAIACATREGELEDNPAALRCVRALRREGRLELLPLAPLAETETRLLVASAVGEHVDAGRVFRESGGNPLFVLEVARALDGGAEPRAFDALLDQRLSRLDAQTRELVAWAAALGRDVDPVLLADASGETFAHVTAALRDLEREAILISSDDRYTFAHDLVRKAAYRTLSGARRRLVHLAIARTLAAAPDPAERWGDVVHHATLAEDAALAGRACVAAGRRAWQMLARPTAKDFAIRGLAEVARLGRAGLATRAELLEIAAVSVATDPTRQVALEANAEEVLRLAREDDRPEIAAKALYALGFFRAASGDFTGAHEVTINSAKEAARTTSPTESLPLLAHSAFCLMLIEREPSKARALLDEAAEGARLHGLSIIDIELGAGYLAHFDGEPVRARRALERALAMARTRGDAFRQSMALIRIAMIDLEAGAWESARGAARELRVSAAKLGDGSEGPIADALECLATEGADLASPLDGLVRADAKAMLAYCLTMAAERAERRRDLGEARSLAERALEAALPLGKPSGILLAHAVLARTARGLGTDPTHHAASAKALAHDPHGISQRARDALATSFDESTDGDSRGARPRKRKR